ncbi:hypothetical protein LTS16_002697 [Friedmanniomyces endolithicus]|nr:hypothetical protein LTR57_002686 [Friedmanniomyces endolithicus]KAK1051232.1 hypothetical protein LTS16_002697 [Friedmanniomyces endolithicus]KAK1084102.1 hypothetical protein LTR33_002860 [Friedmanniomyces endolithicus]
MTPRPASPTSLLWAHQIKRENGHLLGRIQKLESANDQHENRLKHAESAAKSHANQDMTALAERVKALDENGIPERLAKVEKDVMSRLDDVKAETEAVSLKVSSMEKDEAKAEEERRKAFNKDKALLKRLGEAEENLKKYEQLLERVGRRVDEQSIGNIRVQLDALSTQVGKEGSEMKLMVESIIVLERANAELRSANDKLAVEVENLAAKSAAMASASGQAAAVPAKKLTGKRAVAEFESGEEVQTPQPPLKKKKASHKWAGGGADKDIIGQSTNMKRTPRAAASPLNTMSKPAKKTAQRPAAQPVLRSAPRSVPKLTKPASKPAPKVVPPKQSKKAPISQTRPKATAPNKAAPRNGTAAAVAKNSRRRLDGQPDKPIVRAGKGWVEVAVTPSESEDESEEEIYDVKPTRGRPRKAQPAQEENDVTKNTEREDRGARQQATQKQQQAKPRAKRTVDMRPDAPTAAEEPYQPSTAMRTLKAEQEGRSSLPIFNQTGCIISSPSVSPQRPIERKDTKDALLAAVVALPSPPRRSSAAVEAKWSPPPAPRGQVGRRRVIQGDGY